MKRSLIVIAALGAAVLLAVVVTQGLAGSPEAGGECAIEMNVTGMSCAKGCAPRVKAALEAVDGVKSAKVNFETTSASLDATGAVCAEAQGSSVVKALKDAGFGGAVTAIKPKSSAPAKS